MLQFKNLENIPPDILLETFNESFSDYFVRLQLTREQLERKLISDSIDLSLSAGVFESEKLIGFILHGIALVNGEKAAYNAGTGVIPSKRGQQLTKLMYQFILPSLEAAGVKNCYLEVMEQNIQAIKSYESAGYGIHRTLICFKGIPQIQEDRKQHPILALKEMDWDKWTSFWDWQPSWQNAITALKNIGSGNHSIGIHLDEKLVAYASYNPQNNRISQFAVAKDYRNQGLGTALFQYIFNANKTEISLINVDATATGTISFLKSIGLAAFVNQYEMKKEMNASEKA
ncbi:Ribosomal protein S18 acetylase RimI [Pedobacter steynii]|uniref:Ribosomal protein S18 acetylase RimI n=1 Tax=Pedobacter steynii TaxID=430522 RepID=A0A1G9MQR0_9SPHI|nr:GNAT family N-acetyltransferase [Pedobacter steynii]NQX39525.1 GNAT family N-acetyltransferase [Pedobacter steynii]SDL76590.1 Ribosomal protein S18 acetylase RimI [Pedobacter steynii]